MYVNPRTGFIIQIGLRTYRELSKNPAWKKKLAQSPKSSSKARLKNITAHSKQQSPQAQLKTPDEKIDEKKDGEESYCYWCHSLRNKLYLKFLGK